MSQIAATRRRSHALTSTDPFFGAAPSAAALGRSCKSAAASLVAGGLAGAVDRFLLGVEEPVWASAPSRSSAHWPSGRRTTCRCPVIANWCSYRTKRWRGSGTCGPTRTDHRRDNNRRSHDCYGIRRNRPLSDVPIGSVQRSTSGHAVSTRWRISPRNSSTASSIRQPRCSRRPVPRRRPKWSPARRPASGHRRRRLAYQVALESDFNRPEAGLKLQPRSTSEGKRAAVRRLAARAQPVGCTNSVVRRCGAGSLGWRRAGSVGAPVLGGCLCSCRSFTSSPAGCSRLFCCSREATARRNSSFCCCATSCRSCGGRRGARS